MCTLANSIQTIACSAKEQRAIHEISGERINALTSEIEEAVFVACDRRISGGERYKKWMRAFLNALQNKQLQVGVVFAFFCSTLSAQALSKFLFTGQLPVEELAQIPTASMKEVKPMQIVLDKCRKAA